MAAPFDIHSVLLGRNGYGRNGYWLKWFWAENVQMTSDAFIFNYAPVLARVLTQNGRLKMGTPFLFVKISMQWYVAKKRSPKDSPRNPSERCEALFWNIRTVA